MIGSLTLATKLTQRIRLTAAEGWRQRQPGGSGKLTTESPEVATGITMCA